MYYVVSDSKMNKVTDQNEKCWNMSLFGLISSDYCPVLIYHIKACRPPLL